MIIRWSPEAVDDLRSLRRYIAGDNPRAAEAMLHTIINAVENLLPGNPGLGRPGRVPGTRELVIVQTPCIVPYRVKSGVLQILRNYHARRRWLDHL